MVLPDPAVHIVLGTSPSTPPPPTPPPTPPQLTSGPVIVWYRGHDLRVHDHVALDNAIETGRQIIALYVLERGAETDGLSSTYARSVCSTSTLQWGPLSPNGGFALGRVQRWYLHHSLCVLRKQLDRLGITLVLQRVDCADATAKLVSLVATKLGASAVFWNKRHKPRAYPVDSDVTKRLQAYAIVAQGFWSETLMPPNFGRGARFDDFQTYTKFWIGSMSNNPPPRPKPLSNISLVNFMEKHLVESLLSDLALPCVADLELLDGLNIHGQHLPGDVATIGCAAAMTTLASFLQSGRFQRFATGISRRDGMVTGNNLTTSRLSPHVRFGEISPRVLFYAIVDAGAQAKLNNDILGLESARTFLKNMSLREFGYYMLSRYPSAATKPIMPEFEVFPWVQDEAGVLTEAWETGTTGFPIVDAAMRQLLSEGWVHNRMRFLVASFFTKYLLLPWPVGAAHMVRTLVDGDEACNSLGWQWTAGCNSDSFPFSTLVNPLSLHHHTQSVKVAAQYVRKYVTELSSLPDSLIFTPWKATDEERRRYNISIVPHADYRDIRGHRTPSSLYSSSRFAVYPKRIVNGREARSRARRAMELMRRIFSAQRQCRTIVVDQTVMADGSTVLEVMQGCFSSNISVVTDQHGDEMECMDMSMSAVTAPSQAYAVDADVLSVDKVRSREQSGTGVVESPRKKQRVSTGVRGEWVRRKEQLGERNSESSNVMSVSLIAGTSSSISRGEVDLLLNSRNGSQVSSGVSKKHRRSLPENTGHEVAPLRSNVEKPAAIPEMNPRTTAKRPRASNPSNGTKTTSRLSVEALLTSAQNCHDTPKPLRNWPDVGASPFQPGHKPLDVTVMHPPHIPESQSPSYTPQFTIPSPPSPAFQSPMFTNGHNSQSHHPSHLASVGNLGNAHGKFSASPYPGTHQLRFPGISTPVVMQNPGDGLGKMPNDLPNSMRHGELMKSQQCRTPAFSQPLATGQHMGHSAHRNGFGGNRPNDAAMFQGIPQLPMLPTHFQPQPTHNSQVMVPFSGPGGMAMPQLAHPSNAIHSQDGQHQFFALSAMNATHHQQHSAPVFMYPAVSPYIDMRLAGMHGHMQPVLHPILQHPGTVPIGFPKQEGGSALCGQTSRMHPGSGPANRQDQDVISPGGPSNSMEREAIARKMAAMNYYNEEYGGKHWEHWQAIALHLLDQYEFSEDTDRETSKAYVRLCQLKDELRIANPNGPRVTVNHCKEVFRILRLPVTGEWDRRGHGGVRGPYCYGCVKRGTVQK